MGENMKIGLRIAASALVILGAIAISSFAQEIAEEHSYQQKRRKIRNSRYVAVDQSNA